MPLPLPQYTVLCCSSTSKRSISIIFCCVYQPSVACVPLFHSSSSIIILCIALQYRGYWVHECQMAVSANCSSNRIFDSLTRWSHTKDKADGSGVTKRWTGRCEDDLNNERQDASEARVSVYFYSFGNLLCDSLNWCSIRVRSYVPVPVQKILRKKFYSSQWMFQMNCCFILTFIVFSRHAILSQWTLPSWPFQEQASTLLSPFFQTFRNIFVQTFCHLFLPIPIFATNISNTELYSLVPRVRLSSGNLFHLFVVYRQFIFSQNSEAGSCNFLKIAMSAMFEN